MNAAFLEEEEEKKKGTATNGVKATNGSLGIWKQIGRGTLEQQLAAVEKEIAKEKEGGRAEYTVGLESLRKIDSLTVMIPDYGSLAGRLARLLAVVVGKEEEKEEVKEDVEGEQEEQLLACGVKLHCHKCDVSLSLDGEYSSVHCPLASFRPPPDPTLPSSAPGEYSSIMPHLEDKHPDFVSLLHVIFPPAKKRLPQFVERAAERSGLLILLLLLI